MLCTTLSNRDKVNNNIQNIEIGNRKFCKYILLYQTLSNVKVTCLHINNVNNIDIRYEHVKNADMNDIAEHKEQSRTIRDIFLNIKINNMLLFTGVE